ncbi:MAG TPA: TAXI family TRAP transporter solute-binding subunit [Candidatus Lustribacter sp.]|jgi:TRAP-type uncharacterized transport system substrate-binding protein|nr:TAXI family TRAP transporter solute-binding subunit [Candidatus Lustribacter sp.]
MSAKARAASALEIAKGLVLSEDRRFWQITLDVEGIAAGGGPLTLFASDNPEGIQPVVDGTAAMALVNPSVMLTLAYRGTGPFREPLPVRAIAVMPSYDLFAFVVTPDTGLTSLEDVRARRFPLRISLRGQRSHSIHTVLDCTLAAAGFSVDELRSWGGSIHYEPGFDAPGKSGFDSPARLEMAKSGEINAIFDEAIVRWLDPALEMGMRALPLGATTVRNLEAMGFRANVIEKAVYPRLEGDVETIDFSGFAVFVRADAPDALVTAICAGLDVHRADIPWEGNGPLPIADMCRDTPDGPLDVPLHPAAERYWNDLGYHAGERSGLRGQIQPRQEKPERPPRIRSMLTLEVASEILARAGVSAPGAYATRIRLRQQTQDGDTWFATIAAADRPDPEATVTVIGDGELVFRPGTTADVEAAIRTAAKSRLAFLSRRAP